MNTRLVTTGPARYTVNSTPRFRFLAELDGLLWDITGGTATLKLLDPGGNLTSVAGTVEGSSGYAGWTVPDTPGTWARAWDLVDASGRREVSLPVVFEVTRSPGP